jgi:hypothetical protein
MSTTVTLIVSRSFFLSIAFLGLFSKMVFWFGHIPVFTNDH